MVFTAKTKATFSKDLLAMELLLLLLTLKVLGLAKENEVILVKTCSKNCGVS